MEGQKFIKVPSTVTGGCDVRVLQAMVDPEIFRKILDPGRLHITNVATCSQPEPPKLLGAPCC